MAADAEVVRDRLGRIRRYVGDLRSMSDLAGEAFKANRERQYAVLHALQLAIETVIEIGTYICSADNLGVPGSYAETFDLLEQGHVIGQPLAARLRTMARFRNRIVHFYWDVDLDEIYRILQERLGDFCDYLAAVERYLEPPATVRQNSDRP